MDPSAKRPNTVPVGGDIIEVVAPHKDGTTAGRLISKRGDGGYMIIMQGVDAEQTKKHILSKGLSKVITEHAGEDAVMVQYHPKGIKGQHWRPSPQVDAV